MRTTIRARRRPPIRSSLADRCREARQVAGLSIGQAQRLSGVERIDGIESGRLPTADELTRLASTYGVSISWLRDGVATMLSAETMRAAAVSVGEVNILLSAPVSRAEIIRILGDRWRPENTAPVTTHAGARTQEAA